MKKYLNIARQQREGEPVRQIDTDGKRKMLTAQKNAKLLAAANIVINLLILCTFKYFNFFAENLYSLFHLFGFELDWVTMDILLPVGISFYTFQALGYTIDVYKEKISPTRDIVSFFAFISFFPQLVAGPIERATNFLPQFFKKRHFDYAYATSGMRQMLIGFFKKIVIADNCAVIANTIFDNAADASGSTLLIGALMFTFQIYGDFSGYSDIAIGCAKLFGFQLNKNFNFPYFSRDIAEFWRRWHISLNTWFRDYIYIPLGGSRGTKLMSFRNTMIIFLVSGLWHGANWTFIIWGAYHAVLFAPLLLRGKNRKFSTNVVAENRSLPSLKESGQMIATFVLVLIGWIIFRADNIQEAWIYIRGIFDRSILSLPEIQQTYTLAVSLLCIVILIIFEWMFRKTNFALDYESKKTGKFVRRASYIFIALLIIYFGGGGQDFIYFQF